MRVISRRKLREFWEKHNDAQTSLLLWYQRTIDAKWRNLADVRRVFPSDESTVINILEKRQEITAKQIQNLGNFFHIFPLMFLTSQ